MSLQSVELAALRRALSLRDLTDAAHGPHAMQALVAGCIETLQAAWACALIVHRAPPVVSIEENYDALGYPPDGAARDARYTRYVSARMLLRTQTSAMIPSALKLIAPLAYDDVLIACPGLVYRRDAIDRLHVGEPHQLDLWRVHKGVLTRRDLEYMVHRLAEVLIPGASIRLDAAVHPYTQEGLEVHARIGGEWVEILECGMAHPKILAAAGIGVPEHTGLALGMGLDRLLMLRKGLDDIRLLRATEPRIAAQLLDLAPYRPVSAQPKIVRDLSIAVDAALGAEELGDRVRAALGARAAGVEEISVIASTSYEKLPPAARERLGLSPGQKNVLLRLVIRDLERTLTSAEANRLRDDVYRAVHAGAVCSWAAAE